MTEHIISVQRMRTLTVFWRSIPSWQLWQSTKTGRRWGRCSIYRHPLLRACSHSLYFNMTADRPIKPKCGAWYQLWDNQLCGPAWIKGSIL